MLAFEIIDYFLSFSMRKLTFLIIFKKNLSSLHFNVFEAWSVFLFRLLSRNTINRQHRKKTSHIFGENLWEETTHFWKI